MSFELHGKCAVNKPRDPIMEYGHIGDQTGRIRGIPLKKAPPLVSPRFSTRGAFLCGFYFWTAEDGQGSTLTPPEAENFQDFGVRMTFFIREINGFTWYIRKIFPCGAKENTLPT